MIGDGAESEAGKEGEAAEDQDDPDEQPDPQPPGGGEGAACCWSMALCGEAARDREHGHDHEEAPEPHRDAGEAVVEGRARGEAGEGRAIVPRARGKGVERSEEHTSELQSLMRISYAVFCLKKKKNN